METKVCKYCGAEKPITEFYHNASGYTSCCKECHSKKAAEGRAQAKRMKNAERELENAKTMRLSEFTPRELMGELKRRGYDGKITYTRTETIDLSKI